MLEVKNLQRSYKMRGRTVDALKNFNFTFPDRGMIFILGRSGCGKSTLLHLLAGIDRPTSGSILYNGKDITSLHESELCRYRRETVGLIFQQKNLFSDLSVRRNLLFASGETDACNAVAERLGLKDMLFRNVGELSGGQAQRVAIGRTLLQDCRIILADEPTGNLDEKTGKEIFTLLRELAQQKLVIVVTHDRESAERYADTIIRMRSGEIAEVKQIQQERQTQMQIPRGGAGERKDHLRPFPYVGKICFAAIWNGRRKWQAVLAVLLAALAAVLFGITLLYRTADPAQSLGSFLQQNSELYPRFELNFAYSETCDSPEEAAALLDESGAEYMLYNGSYFFGMTRETVEHFGFTAVTELLPLDDNCFYLDAEEGEKLFAESSYNGYWYDPTLLDDYMQPSYWETHALESFTVQDCVVIDGVEVPLESCGKRIDELVGCEFRLYSKYLSDYSDTFQQQIDMGSIYIEEADLWVYIGVRTYPLHGFTNERELEAAKARVPSLTLAGIVETPRLQKRTSDYGLQMQDFRLKGMIVTAKNFAHFDETTKYKAIVTTDSADPAALLRSFGLGYAAGQYSPENPYEDPPLVLLEEGHIYGSSRYFIDYSSQSLFGGTLEDAPTGVVDSFVLYTQRSQLTMLITGFIGVVAAAVFIILTFQVAHSGFSEHKEDFALMRALGVPRTKIVLYSFAAIAIFLAVALVLCLLTVSVIYACTHILRIPNENTTAVSLFQEKPVYDDSLPMTSWRAVEVLFLTPGLIFGCIAFALVCALPMFVTAVRSGIRGKIADNLRREL